VLIFTTFNTTSFAAVLAALTGTDDTLAKMMS
jgi:hypothetical protein